MKNRFSKVTRGKHWALIMLAISGVTSSCKDEYLLDDKKPAWLNASIYESLQERGNFSTYLKLLADPDVNNNADADNNRGLVDVLSKTGSKTLFVANDDQWEKFFKKNAELSPNDPWHNATSYEKLSVAQKKLLIHTSMLNNAIVMENLASTEGSNPTRGMYLRRFTDVEATDSITYIDANSLPNIYNKEENNEKDQWARFRAENGGKGIYLVTDSTLPMMVHFTTEYLAKNNITDEDFKIISGRPRKAGDVHIHDQLLLEQDNVCENGYVNTTDGVLKPLPNMAEALRTNTKTRIFSHMLERWSVPFFNKTVTEAYKNVKAARGETWTDSIFSKRYFSDLSFLGKALTSDPQGKAFTSNGSADITLKFDPGWNNYHMSNKSLRADMAAMYVPVDDVLWTYFSPGGGGWQLIETYCTPGTIQEYSGARTEEDYEKLFRNIDQIPLSTLYSMINVIMFPSFAGSVPSKMTMLRDDAQEQIFFPEDKQHLVGSILANNGVIYLTDKVYGPANFTSVAAPAYISNDKNVIRWAIYNGSTKATDYMKLYYYAYLKAMQSRFAFFLPDDNAMNYIYDPVSFKSRHPRIMQLKVSDKVKNALDNNTFPIEAKLIAYTPSTGQIGNEFRTENISNEDIINRLRDILESHTIVLDGITNIDEDVNEWYLAKNGAPVHVIRENGKVVKVQGAFQYKNEQKGLDNSNKGITENRVKQAQKLNNGSTYVLETPLVTSAQSVYSVLTNDDKLDDEDYLPFYELTQQQPEIIRACGLLEGTTEKERQNELKKFQIFTSEGAPDQNVQFFNSFNYTVFVPTKAAIEDAIAKGLPTWEDIQRDFNSCWTEEHGFASKTDSLRIRTKITYLTNFVRNHFVDKSVFVDKGPLPAKEYVTASFDNTKGIFGKVMIRRENGKLQVRDINTQNWLTVGGKFNEMTRDIICRKGSAYTTPKDQINMTGIRIDASSFAVVHQIPGVLNHTSLENGRHDSTWATPSNCRAYLNRYAIK